jgi:hypothetical protein
LLNNLPGNISISKRLIRFILSLNLIFLQTFIITLSIYNTNNHGGFFESTTNICLQTQAEQNSNAVIKISNNELANLSVIFCNDWNYQNSKQDFINDAIIEVFSRSNISTKLSRYFQPSFSLRSPPHNLPV